MKKKKALFIINPKAGGKNKNDFPAVVSQTIDATKIDAECVYTKAPLHATQLATDARNKGYDYVLAVGGDGTMNEIAQCLLYSDTVFGIIPFGSGNGLGRTLGIPLETTRAIQLVNKGNFIEIDAGKINDRTFFNVAGMGMDADVATQFANSETRGFFNYARIVLQNLFGYKPSNYTIKANGETLTVNAYIISIANSTQYGNNMHIAPRAKQSDGQLDICIVTEFSPWLLPIYVYRLLGKNIDHTEGYIGIQTAEATIERTQEGAVHADGEPYTDTKKIGITTLPRSLKILIP